MDTNGTKDFVLYSEVSFAQGVIVDHTPLTILANYAPVNVMPQYPLFRDTGGFDIWSYQISHYRGNLMS